MKNLSITFLILIGLGLSSCSSNDKDLAEGADTSEDFLEDGTGESFDEQEVVVDEQSEKQDQQLSDQEAAEAYAPQVASSGSGEMGTYTTQKGETLMQVAFKLYGDYRKWKDIMSLNNLSSQQVPRGMALQYEKPASKFVWNPSGNPYLIKNGDTLGTISQHKYNTAKRWKEIYNNNQPLIRDPNLIFAGFTIYYIPDSGREAASN